MKQTVFYMVFILALTGWGCSRNQEMDSYSAQLSYLQKQYKSFNAGAPRFFLFGMGNRDKYIYKDFQLISVNNDSIVYHVDNAITDSIMPSEYCVSIKTTHGDIKIFENENGIWLAKEDTVNPISINQCYLELPSFNEFKYGKVLKVLHHEILFNIQSSRIYPNILAYKAPFYRDAFMVVLCLEKTGNLKLVTPWIQKIDSIYDMQNHEPEADNLGELLYMLSSIPTDSNKELRIKLMKEIERKTIKKDTFQYIKGHTDGADNADYQTQILKFALKKTGINDNFTNIPQNDTGAYYDLCWFTRGTNHSRNLSQWIKDLFFNYRDSPFPYLQWARAHFYNNNNAAFNCQQYPLSWEKRGGCANFRNMQIISGKAVDDEICYPHAWTAAEMFLKLYEER